jgi:sugar phosphate isomerase/epimerase
MYLTGFTDEAARDIDGQIAATRELGWKHIESRNVDGTNLHDLSEADFDKVAAKLADAGIRISCFGSAIANWSKSIEKPFDVCLAQSRRAAERMKKIGTRLVRIMSYPVLEGRSVTDQMQDERFARLREIVGIFGAEGLTVVHENCMNYGGMGAPFTLEMLDRVPGLKLVFDTGNPVHTDDYTKSEPRPKQSSWDFYRQVREHVVYVHIKDAVIDPDTGHSEHTFPGEGLGDVRRIVSDLIDRGYQGGFSMEPHMKVVVHEGDRGGEPAARFANYVEYGRRFERLLAGLGHPVQSGGEA